MAELDTGLDILTHLLQRGGDILPTQTSADVQSGDYYLTMKTLVNQAYWELCGLRRWSWARKQPPVQFTTVPAITTGSATAIVGNVVRLNGLLLNTVADRKFMLVSEAVPHRIQSHVPGSNELFLVTQYTGRDTSGPCLIFQDEYEPATDILAFPDIRDLQTGSRIITIPEGEMRLLYPRNVNRITRWGAITYAAFVGDNKVRLAPWPECPLLYEISYNYRPPALDFSGNAATDTPIIPRQWRQILGLVVLSKLWTDKSDARFARIREETDVVMRSMRGSEMSLQKPRSFVPRGHRIMG